MLGKHNLASKDPALIAPAFESPAVEVTSRWTIVCVLLLPALLWIASWPFAASAVNDDFSYAFTVRQLLDTGQLRYNGWSSPIVGLQAVWGSLFARAFGFSNDVLRLSMLPVSMACSALTFSLHRRIGLTPRVSLFATALLIGSPIFTSWSASFMTDIPGLLFTLLLFHCLVSAMRCQNAARISACGIAAAIAGLLGGSIRQSLLVLGLAALGAMILRHRRAPVALAGLVAVSLAYLVASFLLIRWHQNQRYTLVEPWPEWSELPTGLLLLLGLFLQSLFFVSPLAAVWIRWAGLRRWTVAGAAVVAILTAFSVNALAPQSFATRLFQGLWVGDTLTPTGMLGSNVDAPGQRPIVFNNAARLVIGAAVFWQIILACAVLVQHRHPLRRQFRQVREQAWNEHAWVFFGLAAIGASYLALLLPRAALRVVFDRYLLVLFPIVSLAILSVAQRRAGRLRISPIAWVAVLVFMLLGVESTFDHFAELRAREELSEQLIRRGVSRTRISNGLPYDGWTQLSASGYVNNRLIENPPGTVVDSLSLRQHEKVYWFLRFAPAITPDYVILNWPMPPVVGDNIETVTFRTLLPPFRRWLVAWPLDRAPDPPQSAADNQSRSR